MPHWRVHKTLSTSRRYDADAGAGLNDDIIRMSVSSSAATATALSWGLGFGFADRDIPALDIRAIECRNGRRRVLPGRHLDKSESARFAAEPVFHYIRRLHITMSRKELLEVVVRDLE